MFHEIAFKIVVEAQMRISGTRFTDLTSNVILYPGGVTLTLLIATVTWRYYELWFLRLKKRFTIVRSGVEAGQYVIRADVRNYGESCVLPGIAQSTPFGS
jgi:peptidoglycan/LPS O-acetylase OafA/YrhL